MKVFSWKLWHALNDRRVRADVIFWSESHLNEVKAIELRIKLGVNSLHVIESDGHSGGLILFYNNEKEVVLNYMTPNLLSVSRTGVMRNICEIVSLIFGIVPRGSGSVLWSPERFR